MASSSTVHASERSKIEQIVGEFFAKSLHIILESRIPAVCGEGDYLGSSASSSSSGSKTRDRWFNLALGDCTAAPENFEPWRRGFSDPMVVDILLDQPKSAERNPSLPRAAPLDHQPWAKGGSLLKGTAEGSLRSAGEGTVLERWTVQYEQRKRGSSISSSLGSKGACVAKAGAGPDMRRAVSSLGAGEAQEMRTDSKEVGSGSSSQKARIEVGEIEARGRGSILPTHVTEVPAVYKRTVVMLRSLYSKCRFLPAYRLFRLSNSPSNCCNFSLSYRVLSSAAPFSEHEKRDLSVYSFTPVETAYGKMRLSVAYRLTTAVIALEVVPSLLPRIIPDYVGSPTTDYMKRFMGEPHSLPSSAMPINRGIYMVSVPSSLQNSPPVLGFGRRHSWSGKVNQMQPALQPPSSPSYRISRSPSPSYPFHPSPPYPPSPYSPFSQKHPASDLSLSPLSSLSSAEHLSGIHPALSSKHRSRSQPINIDNRFSLPFSASRSPSPPTFYPGSDPVSIPKPSHSRGSKFLTGDIHQRNRNLLPPLLPSARKAGVLPRSSSESPGYSGQLLSHVHRSKSFESSLQLQVLHDDHGQQVWRNEGSGPPFPAENLFHWQSQATLSRSSSKTALGDDGEDDDFSCPFAVDDVDAEEKRSSKTDDFGLMGEVPEFSKTPQRRSQDAAVGALVRMLKSASPLRHLFHPDLSLDFGANEREYMSRSPTCSVPESMAGRLQATSLEPPSSMHMTKTVDDALEELQIYKTMRDFIVDTHQGGEEEAVRTLSGK